MSEETTDGPAGGVGRAVRLILRLLSVGLIGLLLGIGAYALGVWTVNGIVTPLQEHAVWLERLEAQIGERRTETDQLDDRMADVQSEIKSDLTLLDQRAEDLSASLAVVEDALANQDREMQSLSQLENDINELEQMTDALEASIEELREEQEVDRLTIERVAAHLTYMRAMVLISRADSLIARNELTAAEQTIEAAVLELADLQTEDEGTQQELEALIQRLELAQGAILSRPEVASEDLDAAWALLAGISDN